MNHSTIILIVIYLVVSSLFFLRPLVIVLESLLAMALASLVIIFSFGPILNFFVSLGIRENVYAPSLVFILSFIIIWAILLTLFSLLVNVGHLTRSYRAGFWSFIISIPFCLIVGSVVCLTITPFVQNQKILDDLNDCFLCKSVGGLTSDLPSIGSELSGISLEIYMPENEDRQIELSSEFEISDLNADKSKLVFDLINKTRKEASAPALDWNEDLYGMAIEYGREISKTKLFAHKNIEGKTVKERSEGLDLNFDYLGENLAIAAQPQQAHRALLDSESHYKNIISPVFARGAVAVFDLKGGFVMLVEQFAN